MATYYFTRTRVQTAIVEADSYDEAYDHLINDTGFAEISNSDEEWQEDGNDE